MCATRAVTTHVRDFDRGFAVSVVAQQRRLHRHGDRMIHRSNNLLDRLNVKNFQRMNNLSHCGLNRSRNGDLRLGVKIMSRPVHVIQLDIGSIQ